MSTMMLTTMTNTAAASTKPMISGRLPWSIASTESWPMPPMPNTVSTTTTPHSWPAVPLGGADCQGGSVERGLAVPGPLELEEPVRLGHQRQPVEQPPGGLALRRRGDDRAEDGVAAKPDDRGADVEPDRVERLVVRGLDLLVELRADRGLRQVGGQAHLGEGLGDHLGVLPAALVVQPGADGRVQRPEDVRAAVLRGRGADPDRDPGPAHPLQVILVQPFALMLGEVEIGERHDPPLDLHRPDLLHLQHPPGGDPGPRAHRIEPELHGLAFSRLRHDRANSHYPPGIPSATAISCVTTAGARVPHARTVIVACLEQLTRPRGGARRRPGPGPGRCSRTAPRTRS